MYKESIIELLESKYSGLNTWLEKYPDEKWTEGPEGKWSAGQQALHLLQSTKPLNNSLSLPKFFLKYRFGKANRPVRVATP